MTIARSLVALSLGGLAILGSASPTVAQASPDSIARFITRAREATRSFQDRSAAIEAGYRRIGPDFPGMGEHWISIGLLFRSSFDAAHPAVLEYVNSGGEPRLVGVAYVLPLLPDEAAPAFPTPRAWHFHSKSLDEESAAIAQVSLAHGGTDGSRLAMLHAWVWLDETDSTFAANNWVLPFLRLGIEPPRGAIPPDAARALSLAADGDVFYKAIYDQAMSSERDSAAIASAVDGARSQVDALLAERSTSAGPEVGAEELSALTGIWITLWERLEKELTPSSYRALSELRHP